MEKEQNPKTEEKINKKTESQDVLKNNEKESETKILPEDKIKELEDKLARTLAEMENQRRRFEKEKDDAFDYGGFSFARESLNLIDNFDRAKQSLENDEKIKGSETLKKTLQHLNIVKKDLISLLENQESDDPSEIRKSLGLIRTFLEPIYQALHKIEFFVFKEGEKELIPFHRKKPGYDTFIDHSNDGSIKFGNIQKF